MEEWAKLKFGQTDWLMDATERFVENASKKALKYADWNSAWRTWMRNHYQWYVMPAGVKANDSTAKSDNQSLEEAMAEMDRIAEGAI